MLKDKIVETRDSATRPELVDPTGFWRFVFWLVFVLGNLALAFAWLLAQAPRPLHGADLRLDYAVRAGIVAFMLVSILMARRIWKINTPNLDQEPGIAMNLVVLVAWFELVAALCGIVVVAMFRR
jgi:hypothetical protein